MPPDDGAHKRPSLALRLEQFWHDNPGASLTTREGLELFGGTGHSFRQAMTVLRRMGTPVRCERVFRLRHQEAHGGTRRAPAAATWCEADAVAAAHAAGFAGTCWTMGPEELVHLLNMVGARAPAGPQGDVR